jgi:TonB family protein
MQKARLPNILSVLVLALFLPLLVIAQEPAKQTTGVPPESKPESWQTFTSPEGRFSAEFPGAPKPSNQPAGPSGNVLHMYSLGTLAAYGVSYFDFAGAGKGPDTPKAALEVAIQGVIKDYGPENLTVSEIELDGNPGRLLTKRLANGYTLRVKIVVVGSRQYQITSILPKPETIGPENVSLYESASSRFLDSFKLVPVTEAELGEIDRWRRDHQDATIYDVLGTGELASHSTGKQPKLKDLKGYARVLRKPDYPSIARTARAMGTVVVQVIIDESGNVVVAQAVSGNPLLYPSCVQAARGSKFTPTQLGGKAVKVTGEITYNFFAQ